VRLGGSLALPTVAFAGLDSVVAELDRGRIVVSRGVMSWQRLWLLSFVIKVNALYVQSILGA
jgi:hypothetical protein